MADPASSGTSPTKITVSQRERSIEHSALFKALRPATIQYRRRSPTRVQASLRPLDYCEGIDLPCASRGSQSTCNMQAHRFSGQQEPKSQILVLPETFCTAVSALNWTNRVARLFSYGHSVRNCWVVGNRSRRIMHCLNRRILGNFVSQITYLLTRVQITTGLKFGPPEKITSVRCS